ncbi:MAG TPA: acyl-CoA dehydrogenase family protein [Chloroflexota bacterium]|jgi:alkylation response protein AidB-like acyl-CoA dehydrogenase
MDFDFTQEQGMLRDLAREFFARESSPQVVRRQMEDATGYTEATWQQMAEMGLHGVAIDPKHGGQGLGAIEQALVLDEMGRTAYAGPYFATAVLAAAALSAGGDTKLLPKIADGSLKSTVAVLENAVSWQPSAVQMRATRDGNDFVMNGTKRFVPWAHVADKIIVVARTDDGTTAFVLDAGVQGLTQTPNQEMDHTSKTSTLQFDDVRVGADAVLGEINRGWDVIGPMLQRAAIGASAEMLGAMRRCMEMSVEYAKVRHQFGQPIGMFQAIKHTCAEMLLDVENAHAATYYAAWAQDAGMPDAALAASVAKAYVGDASRKVCGNAIQVHGGIGFTWEYDLHLYFKRAKHLEALYGDADFHRELALRLALEAPVQQARQAVLI